MPRELLDLLSGKLCLLVRGLEIEGQVPQLKYPDPFGGMGLFARGELGNLIELA